MTALNRPRTVDAVRGKWQGTLLTLGIPREALTRKHGPCPFCGGKDRYRFDDKDGSGSFICSQCGSGNGFDLLKRLKGWDFAAAAREIDQVVGNVTADPPRRTCSVDVQRRRLNELWRSAQPVQQHDPVGLYLASRDLPMPANAKVIRFAPSCPAPDEPGARLAMIARVSGPDGSPATVHRTFLTPQGRKADMPMPRALMPGEVPAGAAIRLAEAGETLGIAEGIETALAATKRFGVPVWSTISSAILAKWEPPLGVKHVIVFGDNDPKFGGQAAAFALAHRLAVKGITVEPRIPITAGTDWADKEAA